MGSPYKIMASVLKNKRRSREEAKKINSFFFARWLANNRFTIPISNIINTYYNIPVDVQYIFVADVIDLTGLKNKVKFIQFQQQKTPDELKIILNNIKEKYKVNEQQAFEYFKMLPDEELNKIYNLYKDRDGKQR